MTVSKHLDKFLSCFARFVTDLLFYNIIVNLYIVFVSYYEPLTVHIDPCFPVVANMFYAAAAVGEVTHCQTAREVQDNADGREATFRSDP